MSDRERDLPLVTATMAAVYLLDRKVTPAIVRLWVSKGWLRRAGTIKPGEHGQTTHVYDVRALWGAYNRWREQPGVSGRRGPRLPGQ